MSYLNALRLHFAGQFQASPSTVNNDPTHYSIAAYQPAWQKPGDASGPNGWWNPQGDAAFRLLGCKITSAWTPSGRVLASDPVLGYGVADSDGRVPAKIVDLDPEQQMVSTIWGLEVRITEANGNTVLRGEFEPVAFIDLWQRAAAPGDDAQLGSMWQSVLKNLWWGDVSASPFLRDLQQAVGQHATLSIKFNVDGYNMTPNTPGFTCGRIVGTIGPAAPGEPAHMVIGRQFMAGPGAALNYCVAVVDTAASQIYLDLGNALPTTVPGGPFVNLGDLSLQVTANNNAVTLNTLPAAVYTAANWYVDTAGVVALTLTAAQLQQIAASPLTIQGSNSAVANNVISEWANGAYVRADSFVYRMSPGDTVDIPIYAMQWGTPLPDATLSFLLDASQLQMGSVQGGDLTDGPPVAIPDILNFEGTANTTPDGGAMFRVTAGDPGAVRASYNGVDYGIDGQIYGIRPGFSTPSGQVTLSPQAAAFANGIGNTNPANFISFLVWSGFTSPYPLTWTDLQPIFQQYANLYPVMNRFLNLADYDSVVANTRWLKLAFSLVPEDPNAMPVTRDLSPAKRNAILAWLDNPLPGPIKPANLPAPAARPAPNAANSMPKGGKSAALARRLVLRSR